MAPEVALIGVAAGLAFASAAILSFLRARARSRFQAVESAWKRYADAKGMRFTRASGMQIGGGKKVQPPTLDGEVQGVLVDVTVQSTELGPMTRVEATIPSVSEDFLFAIYRRASLTQITSEFSDVSETITGNKVFDGAYALLSNESDTARSILDRRLAQVVGDFPRKFSYLYSSQTRFTLIWPGMETEPAILDAAINVVWTACRRRA